MAETNTTRLSLRQWGAGTDTLSRSEVNSSFLSLENLTAIDKQDVFASRPAAGVRGTYFWDTTNSYLWRDSGVAWSVVGSRTQDTIIKSSVTGNVPLTIDTPAAQTADLLQLKFNGTTKARVDKDGNGIFGTLAGVSGSLVNTATGTVALQVTGASGQTADLLQIRGNGPVDRFKVAADGTTTSPFGKWGTASTINTDTATNVGTMAYWSGTPRTEIRMAGTGTFNEFVYLKNAAVVAGAATRRMGLVLKVGGEDATGAAQSAAMYLRSDAANFDAPSLYLDVRDLNVWKMDSVAGSVTPYIIHTNGAYLRATPSGTGGLQLSSAWLGTQGSGNNVYYRAGTTSHGHYFYAGGTHSDTTADNGSGLTLGSLIPSASGSLLSVGRLNLTQDNDTSLAASTPTLMIGSASGKNLIFSSDEITARNNGANSPLYLQSTSGELRLGGTTARVYINDVNFYIGGTAPAYKESGTTWINNSHEGDGGGVFRWNAGDAVWVRAA